MQKMITCSSHKFFKVVRVPTRAQRASVTRSSLSSISFMRAFTFIISALNVVGYRVKKYIDGVGSRLIHRTRPRCSGPNTCSNASVGLDSLVKTSF